MIMPFGKFKGEEIEDIPLSYLEWLYDNIELHGPLEQAIGDAIDDSRYEQSRRGRIVKDGNK